jgi:hypothetical protein
MRRYAVEGSADDSADPHKVLVIDQVKSVVQAIQELQSQSVWAWSGDEGQADLRALYAANAMAESLKLSVLADLMTARAHGEDVR